MGGESSQLVTPFLSISKCQSVSLGQACFPAKHRHDTQADTQLCFLCVADIANNHGSSPLEG